MDEVERLKSELSAKGGTQGDWDFLLNEGMRMEDHQVYSGEHNGDKDPMELASRVMSPGRIMEYSCFDGRWRSQGVALVELKEMEDERKRLVRGRHVVASDEYYEWYAGERLAEDRCVYHLCQGNGRRCTAKLTSRDRRELVHVPKWRMINTGMMLNEDYSRAEGLARLKEGVNRFVAHPVAPPAPPVRMDRGTGLDEAAAGLGGFEEELRERKKSRSPKRRSPKKKEAAAKKTVRTVLREKVHRYEESHPEKKKKSRGKRKKKGEGDREAKKKLSRGDSGASTDSSDESDGGSSDSLFPLPPSRGGAELWRLANKYPGRLLKSGLMEMSRYLADRAGDEMEESWHTRKVMAYVNQVMLNSSGGPGVGVRNQREAITLGVCLDHLTSGNLASLGDVLIQRLKALEAAMADQNWQSARHLELIPPQSAALATTGEKDQASKVELRMLKLKAALTKTKSK